MIMMSSPTKSCWSHPRRVLGAVVCFVLMASGAVAHHDPATEAASLTAEIKQNGPEVKTLLERARLWRVLRKLDLAIADLTQAAELDPSSLPARQALAQAYYVDGQLKPAFATIEQALDLAEAADDRATLHMMRASIHLAWKDYEKAAADCGAAFKALPEHRRIEWYLRRAHVQRMAGRFLDCEKGLRAGHVATGSAVLYTQWVDALIDAKLYEEAGREVERQLPGLRFAASWKIRRARIFQAEDRDAEAETELKEALEELNGRIRPEAAYPDITLLVDRGLTHFLLGDRDAAKADYERAKKAGALGWMHWRLAQIFEKKAS